MPSNECICGIQSHRVTHCVMGVVDSRVCSDKINQVSDGTPVHAHIPRGEQRASRTPGHALIQLATYETPGHCLHRSPGRPWPCGPCLESQNGRPGLPCGDQSIDVSYVDARGHMRLGVLRGLLWLRLCS